MTQNEGRRAQPNKQGQEPAQISAGVSGRVPRLRGLPVRLLILTVLFIMLVQALIFLPSLANFRLSWLDERLSTASAVGAVLMQSDSTELSREVQDDVLVALGAMALAVRDEDSSQLLIAAALPQQIDLHIDLGEIAPLTQMHEALYTLFFGGNRILRIFATMGVGDQEFELVMSEADLRQAMIAYARNIVLLSVLLSLLTAVLLYYVIDKLMVQPIRAMTRSMLSFAQAPDDPARIIRISARNDEIGVAEHELAAMQNELQRLLQERRRLADLGLAVSKINHDMRNILAAAQLMSDRLAQLQDPAARNLASRLVRTLDRAIAYSEGVLAYGRAQQPEPRRRWLLLKGLVDEVFALLAPEQVADIELINGVDADFEINADPDQLFRVLFNLARNAVEAMGSSVGQMQIRRLTISASRDDAVSHILLEDTGPGLPQKARDNLFSAFRGSARSGGTGLGLAIAYELVRAHGGRLDLVDSRSGSTVFAITIPDQL